MEIEEGVLEETSPWETSMVEAQSPKMMKSSISRPKISTVSDALERAGHPVEVEI